MHGTFKTIETKADLLTLESLIAWLEKRNPNEHYAWHCQGECMLGLWLKSIDYTSGENPNGDSFSYIVNGVVRSLDEFAPIALYGEPTFGAALLRARDPSLR